MLTVEGGAWGLGFAKAAIDSLCLCWGLGEGVRLGALETPVVATGLTESLPGCEPCTPALCPGE